MARKIGAFICEGIFNTVPHARLRRQMDHAHDGVVADERSHLCSVGNVDAFKCEAVDAGKSRQPRLFQCGIVIVIDDVDANDTLTARKQPMRHGVANETGCACYEYRCRHVKKRPYASTQMRGQKTPRFSPHAERLNTERC
jgi:hypothetical protein